MCVVGRNILVVGVADKGNALKELPVRVLAMDTGSQAIRCLKEERIDTVISHWELMDIPAGRFLKNVTEAKPSTPTIAFIKSGDIDQEIAARKLGVDAVLSEDINDDYFREIVCQLLRISAVASMQIVNDYNDNGGVLIH
jgi:DNA-binding NarL/FixJ family response regulator